MNHNNKPLQFSKIVLHNENTYPNHSELINTNSTQPINEYFNTEKDDNSIFNINTNNQTRKNKRKGDDKIYESVYASNLNKRIKVDNEKRIDYISKLNMIYQEAKYTDIKDEFNQAFNLHNFIIECKLQIKNSTHSTRGVGNSKIIAKQNAAKAMLDIIEKLNNQITNFNPADQTKLSIIKDCDKQNLKTQSLDKPKIDAKNKIQSNKVKIKFPDNINIKEYCGNIIDSIPDDYLDSIKIMFGNNIDLYNTAFMRKNSGVGNNERMEFIGDAIIDCGIYVIATKYFKILTAQSLYQFKTSLICNKTLANIAVKMKIPSKLKLSKYEYTFDNQGENKIYADCFEALIGALYLSNGLMYTFNIIENIFFPLNTGLDNSINDHFISTNLINIKESFGAILFKLSVSFILYESGSEFTPKQLSIARANLLKLKNLKKTQDNINNKKTIEIYDKIFNSYSANYKSGNNIFEIINQQVLEVIQPRLDVLLKLNFESPKELVEKYITQNSNTPFRLEIVTEKSNYICTMEFDGHKSKVEKSTIDTAIKACAKIVWLKHLNITKQVIDASH